MESNEQPKASNRQATMQSRRIELAREISIRVPAFDSFVTEYSSNVSTTGMFIRSEKPLPPDTDLTFEFRVAEDWKLIRGQATVVWSRYRDEGPDRPAGMGVLFTELDAQSRRLINWIIEKHVRDGGTPFDLGELKEQYDERLADMSTLEGAAAMPPAVTRVLQQPKSDANQKAPPAAPLRPSKPKPPPEPLRLRLGPLLLAGLIVAVVLGGLFWLSEQGAQTAAKPDLPELEAADEGGVEGSEETVVDASPAPGGSAPPAEVQESPTASSSPAAVTSPARSPEVTPPAVAEAVRRLISSWSQAWQDQDVEAYLSHYAQPFTPANGQTRTAWAETRQQRLTAPEFIEITLTDVEIEWLGASSARVTFNQRYRSNSFEDNMRKELELTREGDRWKILEEKAAG